MENIPHKHTAKTVIVFIIFTVLLTLLSLVLFFLQMSHTDDLLSGQIINIAGNEITVMDAKGNETILIMSSDTKVKGEGEDFGVGIYIYSSGHLDEEGRFESQEIRVIKKK